MQDKVLGENKRWTEWMRWIALPFASFVGGTLGALAFQVVQWLSMKFKGGFAEDGWYYLYLLPILATATFGYLFTVISYLVAPRAKFRATVVMIVLLAVVFAFMIAFAWIGVWMGASNGPVRAVKLTVEGLVALSVSWFALKAQAAKAT